MEIPPEVWIYVDSSGRCCVRNNLYCLWDNVFYKSCPCRQLVTTLAYYLLHYECCDCHLLFLYWGSTPITTLPTIQRLLCQQQGQRAYVSRGGRGFVRGVLSVGISILQSFHSRCTKYFDHHRRLDIPPDSEFIMTTEDVRETSAMSAIQELMMNLHQALHQEKKGDSKDN